MQRFVRITVSDLARLVAGFDWKRKVTAVHVHHTWRPDHAQWQGLRSVEGMWRFHTQERGFADIAQHVTIDPEGFVWTGRGWNEPPASAKGFNGTREAGPFMVEMAGDFDLGRDPFGGAQKLTALKVTAALLDRFDLGIEAVRFHRELSPKSCPGTGIDHRQFLEEVRGWRGQVLPQAGRRRGAGAEDDLAHDQQSIRQLRQMIEEAPRTEGEPPDAEPDDGAAALASAHDHGRDVGDTPRDMARRALSAADREKLRRHVVNSRGGVFRDTGAFATDPTDVAAIFAEHLPAFARDRLADGEPLRVAFYAHGGLNDEATGLDIALVQTDWWLANKVYPVFFVWETGLLETLGDVIASKLGSVLGRRDLRDLTDPGVEGLVRASGIGPSVWSAMKLSAARGVLPGGATELVVERLAEFLAGQAAGRPVELHAVGHSAGAIFHSWFVPAAAARAGRPFETLALLAPAIRVDEFEERLLPRMGGQVERTAIFTMRKSLELDDGLLGVYGKSLLYMISRGLEGERQVPILGLEVSLRGDDDLVRAFGLLGQTSAVGGEVVFSTTAPVTAGPAASTATSHGGFDNDGPTMNAVLRRVVGRLSLSERLDQEFPAEAARTVAVAVAAPRLRDPLDYLPEDVREELARLQQASSVGDLAGFGMKPGAAAPHLFSPATANVAPSTGRRRALCVGINAYPTAPLAGCVADAGNWRDALASLGFEPPELLTDAAATRERILGTLDGLIRGSRPGDVVVFQYAGHGTQLDDLGGDETDDSDEAICPVDFAQGAYVIDDDFADVFARIPDGVNVTCFFDCCHSGTMTRLAVGGPQGAPAPDARARFLRPTAEMQASHRAFRQRGAAAGARGMRGIAGPRTDAGRERMRQVVFAACKPDQVAWESGGQGDFTRLALPILRRGSSLSHRGLQKAIDAAFGPAARQNPNLDCASANEEALLFAVPGAAAQPALGPGRDFPATPAGRPGEAWARVADALAAALRAGG